jgi:hypothetical protein
MRARATGEKDFMMRILLMDDREEERRGIEDYVLSKIIKQRRGM